MRKITAILVILAGLLCLILLGSVFSHWLDRMENGWAYANPALMRTWQGDGLAGQTRLRFALSLSRDEIEWFGGDTSDSWRSIHGKATFCDSTGRVQTYSVSGVVRDKHGQNTFLEFSPPADEVPGLRPTRMNLTWDGSSVLRGKAELAHTLPQGGTMISSSDPETGHPVLFLFNPASGMNCVAPQ